MIKGATDKNIVKMKTKYKYHYFLQLVTKFSVDRNEQTEDNFFATVDHTYQSWSGRREAVQRSREI